MDTFKKRIDSGAEVIALVGGGIALLLAIVTLIFALLRYTFRFIIPGYFTLSEMLLLVLVCLPWAYTLMHRGHPRVEIVVSRLQGKPRAIMLLLGEVISVAFCGMLGWVVVSRVLRELTAGAFLMDLPNVPKYPFWLMVGLAALFFLVVSLMLTLQAAKGIKAKKAKGELLPTDTVPSSL